MPLNVSPLVSVLVTFLMLGLLGWTSAARVLCSTAGSLRDSDFVRQARASGIPGARLFWIHVLPNLKPVLYAQFWISIPAFILSEANLGILGLGVAEPMPSWGSLLKELEGLVSVGEEPWKFVPLILLVVVVTSFQLGAFEAGGGGRMTDLQGRLAVNGNSVQKNLARDRSAWEFWQAPRRRRANCGFACAPSRRRLIR